MYIQDFLKKTLHIDNNIYWSYPLEDREKHESKILDALLSNIAFSFLDNKTKKYLYEMVQNNKLEENSSTVRDLDSYFDQHYRTNIKQYPDRKKLMEKLVDNIYKWIIIVNGELSKKSINNILKNFKTNDELFWLALAEKLYISKKYKESYYLIDKISNLFNKNSYLYEDLMLYKLNCIKNMKYLKKQELQDEMLDLSYSLKNYSNIVILTQLEYYTLQKDSDKFDDIIENNLESIEEFSIFNLLDIYELSILCHSDKSQKLIHTFLLISDIWAYKGEEEYLIYNLLNAISQKKISNILEGIKELKDDYNFDHILWYYDKNEKMKRNIKKILREKL